MANHVYPLGYSTPGAQERIEELLEKKTLIIDTRLKPWSHNVFWRKEELENVYGERYKWAGAYLGNENYKGGQIKLVNPEMGIRGLTRYLNEQHDLILLCQCKTFSACHVSTICNLLIQAMPQVTVVQYNGNAPLQQYSNTVSLFDGNTALPDYSNAVLPSHCQEWRYSVSDVAFSDVGKAPVPDEYKTLYDEYCAEIDILPVETPMWRSATPEYKNVLLEKSRHKAYTRSLLCSGDEKAMRAALEAMLNQLDRYYESQQQKEHVEECRKNLLKARQEGRKWTRVRGSQNRRVLGA